MENSDLNARLAALSPAKRVLLEQKLRQSAVGKAAVLSITRRAERDFAPLSFAQQRLWFLSQLEPESSSYNESSAIRLTGALNRDALRAAIDQLVARHEVLRTTLGVIDGEPRQWVKADAQVELPVIDLRATPADERGRELQKTLLATMRWPFDLSRDLPLRVLLVQVADQEHVLLKVMHHIASDGWSTAIVWRELAACYRDSCSGVVTNLPELAIQYQDYAAWQRTWLQGAILDEQLTYWKKALHGLRPLNLPTDRPRAEGNKSAAARVVLDLDAEVTAVLKEFSKQQGVTLFMTLLAAFQTLLQRYSGQDDIVVGSPIAGRTRPELEGLIGFFVNTLVLRLDLSNDPTFLQVLNRARDTALGAYAHQELPFERIVEELNPVRTLDTLPLFNVMFAHQTAPPATVEFAGLEASAVEVPSLEAKFDLFFAVVERGGRLRLRMDYAVDRFERATVERMLGNFQTLLRNIAEQPALRISELELITPAEKHRLLVEWNDTKQDYPDEPSVTELFECQALKAPDTVAVLCDDKRLTYRELNAKANQLAHYLAAHGVRKGAAVALCMERSLDVVIGLLAILKAGGVYVPLDPQYPAARLQFMMEDTRAVVLLTQERLLGRFLGPGDSIQNPKSKIENPICVDRDWQKIGQQSTATPENRSAPDDVAYIIYTSGSTGVPKGVLGHHRGLINRFHWMWQRYPFEQSEVCCQKTSLSFVDSLWELLGPLLRGVPTVIVAEAAAQDPLDLIASLARHNVSRIVLVPSLLGAMLAAYPDLQERLPALNFWVSSGEALTSELVQQFRRGLPKSRLINLYGSSEVAADVTCWEMSAGDNLSAPSVGRPIANTRVYILDAHLNPVPLGIPGELYIGGAGVARGYLNQAELTAERFIEHSFDGEPAQRLYKTGDRARYRLNGDIEFLGRADNQVKIRGYRIELGEIEAALSQHPAVRESAVIAFEEPAAEADKPQPETRLVACVVAHSPGTVAVGELREFLRAKLPEPMIPAAYVFIDALPLTASGKVDRRALPRPDGAVVYHRTNFQAPRTAIEKLLAAIWTELLGVERVGVHDNFFDLGGHSLLLVRLRDRVRKALGKETPLAMLFRAPTIAQFAQVLEREEHGKSSPTLVPIRASGSQPPFFCVHGAWGSVVFGAELSRHLGTDQPFYGLQAPGLEGEQEPLTRIEDMAAHHVRAMRRAQPEGPYFVAGLSLGGLVAYEIAKQLAAQGQKVALLALIDTYCPVRRSFLQVWRGRARRLLVDDVFGRAVFHGRNLVLGGIAQGSTYAREKTRKLGKRVAAKLRLDHQGNQAHLGDVYAVKVRKANFEAMRRYEPRAYPGRITLLVTSDIPVGKQDGRAAWRELALGGLDIRIVPGNHSTMLSESHVGALAATLGNCLQQAQAARISSPAIP